MFSCCWQVCYVMFLVHFKPGLSPLSIYTIVSVNRDHDIILIIIMLLHYHICVFLHLKIIPVTLIQ